MRIERTDDGIIVTSESEAETNRFGQAIARAAEPGTVIGLVGNLGAGKTRLAKAVAAALGVDPESVLSPTFVLIHEYEGDLPVYHFDAYRLGGPGPLEALGATEYWTAGGICLVEWADLVESILPDDAWRVSIEVVGPESRRLSLRVREPFASRIADSLAGD